VQQNAVCLYACERNEGRNGDFEAEDLHQLLDGDGEDLVCPERDPTCRVNTLYVSRAGAAYQKSAEIMQAVRSHCDELNRSVSML
jgi:hypothetical protein